MDKFSELKAAAMAATPGPWHVVDQTCRWNIDDEDGVPVAITQQRTSTFNDRIQSDRTANTAFIAAANPAVVLALLAELEAKKKHIADMENVVAAAKCDDELWDAMAHRLKTLEAKLNHYVAAEHARASFDQTADIIKRADDAEQAVEELRAKLATPVRLPEGSGWASDQYNHGRNNGIHECKEAIRAAGITVEGDE